MRGWCCLVALFLILSVQVDPSDPTLTNQILGGFHRLDLAPGGSGALDFRLLNPYQQAMGNATLTVEIYEFLKGKAVRPEDGTWKSPVFLPEGAPRVDLTKGTLAPLALQNLSLSLQVPEDAPHGDVFTEGTYVVRFRLEFDLGPLHMVMVSPGFFSPATWANATAKPSRAEQYATLGAALGLPTIGGILPDTAFGVKIPLPLWPFYATAVAAGLLGFLALVAYSVERPGSIPPLEPLGRRLQRSRRRDKDH